MRNVVFPALGLGLGMILAPPPAAAQSGAVATSHEWFGATLHFIPSRDGGCDVNVQSARIEGGQIVAQVTSRARGDMRVSLSARLSGNGQTVRGSGSSSLGVRQTGSLRLMAPYAGSLDGSVLTLSAAGCSFSN
jgi:hypothetical protein